MKRNAVVALVIAAVWTLLTGILLGCSKECDEEKPCGEYQLCINYKCEFLGGYKPASDAGARRDGG